MSNPPKERGSAWERRVVDRAQEAGLPWDRAPLRGSADLLDVQGCQAGGFLIGCKAISRSGSLADKLGPAMVQGRRAAENWMRLHAAAGRAAPQWSGIAEEIRGLGPGEVVPVQIIQRSGYPVGQAYAVMEYDAFLRLAVELADLRAKAAA